MRQKYGGLLGGMQPRSGSGGSLPAPPLTPAAATQQPPQQSTASPAGLPPALLSSPASIPGRPPPVAAASASLLIGPGLPQLPQGQSTAFAWAPGDVFRSEYAADPAVASAVPLPGAWTTAFSPPRRSAVSLPPGEVPDGPSGGSLATGEEGGVPYSAIFVSPSGSGELGSGGHGTAGTSGGSGGAAGPALRGWRSPLNSPAGVTAAFLPPPMAPQPAAAAYPAVLQQQQWRTPHQAAAAAALAGSVAGYELPFSLITSSPALPPMGHPPRQVAAGAPSEPLQVTRL